MVGSFNCSVFALNELLQQGAAVRTDAVEVVFGEGGGCLGVTQLCMITLVTCGVSRDRCWEHYLRHW